MEEEARRVQSVHAAADSQHHHGAPHLAPPLRPSPVRPSAAIPAAATRAATAAATSAHRGRAARRARGRPRLGRLWRLAAAEPILEARAQLDLAAELAARAVVYEDEVRVVWVLLGECGHPSPLKRPGASSPAHPSTGGWPSLQASGTGWTALSTGGGASSALRAPRRNAASPCAVACLGVVVSVRPW